MTGQKEHILIIGYGNTLRSDDSVGQIVGMEVEAWNLPQVTSIYVHQLTPELAEKIAEFGTVIFVDASIQTQKVSLTSIKNKENSKNWTHHLTPASIIYLTQFLYQAKPQAWLIHIPIENLNFGEKISNLAQQGKQEALKIIRNIIELRIQNSELRT